jgi:nucleotide-binding universal stress UspA family protein
VKPASIVCPVEFSAEGKSALAMALALASWYEAELHVVRVESRFRSQSKRPEGGVADDAVCARVDDFVAAVNVQGSNVETVALAGDPVAALVDYSRSISAELMVVGQNGRRGSPYWSAGSFSKEVADRVGCPTITVPRDFAPQTPGNAPFRNILCGIDFSQSSALALSQALLITRQSGGRLTLLHVYEPCSEQVIPGHPLAPRLPEVPPAR